MGRADHHPRVTATAGTCRGIPGSSTSAQSAGITTCQPPRGGGAGQISVSGSGTFTHSSGRNNGNFSSGIAVHQPPREGTPGQDTISGSGASAQSSGRNYSNVSSGLVTRQRPRGEPLAKFTVHNIHIMGEPLDQFGPWGASLDSTAPGAGLETGG